MKVCKINECERINYARGYCNTHYRRLKESGEFGGSRCKAKECLKYGWNKGYCNQHYLQVKNNGEIARTRYDRNAFEVVKEDNIVYLFLEDEDGNTKEDKIIVDLEDFEKIKPYKWSAHYITKHVRSKINGKYQALHRFILDLEKDSGGVDHIDRNPLNNRKNNLRIVTHAENAQNRTLPINNKSGVRGVWRSSGNRSNPWGSQINFEGKRYRLGNYKTREEAIQIRLIYELELYGEFSPYEGEYDYLIEEYYKKGGDLEHDTEIRRIKGNC